MVLPRFLAELKHRNVYRAAVVYAAVGWALLEAADVVLPRLGLPDWTVNLVLALVLLGFPLAIVFAWIFDIGAQGIVRTEPISPQARHRFSFVSIAEFVLICLLVGIVGYLYVERLSFQKRLVQPEIAVQETPVIPNPEHYRAIAVLPFADMSETGDQAWFAEGIAEELLQALAGVEGLQVMARTSSFAFKDTDKTIAQIADILGVQAVLEGSVRRFGERVRITAQLVDARSGYHIWSGSYERQLDDIFELQDELAKSIVQTLRIQLGRQTKTPLVEEQTKSLEAYHWFVRGRALLDWADPKSSFQAIRYLEKAVEADPNYAQAWGLLAWGRGLSTIWKSYKEVSPGAIEAYKRALKLDPEQSEALATKAFITQISSYDYETAGKLYQKAIASAENANALTTYALFYLAQIDQLSLAVRLFTEAEIRDPLHAGNMATLAYLLLRKGEIQAAINKANEVIEINPGHTLGYMVLIEAHLDSGNYEAARRVLDSIPEDLKRRPRILVRAGMYYAAINDKEKARKIYEELLENHPPHGLLQLAALAVDLGEVEQAIDLMEREVEEQTWSQFWARDYYRREEAVNHNPRYLALLRRIGLDDESVAALNARMSFN